MNFLGAGLVSRNITDYEQEDGLFRSNLTDFEIRYRKLEREMPDFIGQNDRIQLTLRESNDTFRIETTQQLSKKSFVYNTSLRFFEICFQLESINYYKTSIRLRVDRIINTKLRSTKLWQCRNESMNYEKR